MGGAWGGRRRSRSRSGGGPEPAPSQAPEPLPQIEEDITHGVSDGGSGCRGIYLATVVRDVLIPSFNSSPGMRGAPQSGLSWRIARIRLQVSDGIGRRLGRRRPRRPPTQRQNPGLRYRFTVSICMLSTACGHWGQRRDKRSHKLPLAGENYGRLAERFSATSGCPSARRSRDKCHCWRSLDASQLNRVRTSAFMLSRMHLRPALLHQSARSRTAPLKTVLADRIGLRPAQLPHLIEQSACDHRFPLLRLIPLGSQMVAE